METRPWPEPGPGEAVVEMEAAPINPADLNAIEGKYPVRPELPATPGFEGCGVVRETGRGVEGLAPGTRVILPHNIGTWREALAVPAHDLVAVPSEIEVEQAAMLKINPITAWRMLHDFVELRPGDWLIQNAANSGAGQAVIQIAKDRGFRTINVVRRAEVKAELEALGADVVLVDSETLRDEVKSATGGEPVRLGLNAVGGDSALRLANCLAPKATLVTFGAMSLQPLKIPNGLLIFKNLILTGFWVNQWYDRATPAQREETFAPLFALARKGKLRVAVARSYPLTEAHTAVAHAAQGEREGKVLFRFGES